MKKLTLLLCFVSFLTKAQNITVASGKSFTIEKTGSVTMSGNFSNAGTFTLNSDSDEFSSIIIGGSVTGNISYNRYVNSVGTNEWDLIGAPVEGQSISSFASANASTLATNGTTFAIGYYENAGDTWTNYTQTTIGGAGNFEMGKGFQMATISGGTLKFTGAPASQTQTQAIINNDAANSGAGTRWSLVSNPFPSYIHGNTGADSSNNFLTVNSDKLDDSYEAIYGYDADGIGSGYTVYNNTTTARGIAPGQAFMVASDNTSYDNVSFTTAMRTTEGGDDFIAGNPITYFELVLKLYVGETEIEDTKFYFKDGLTLGLDPGYDAGHFNQSAALLTRLVAEDQGVGLAVNAVGIESINDVVVPLEINRASGETFRITVDTFDIFGGINVYLEDTQNDTMTLLNEQDFELIPENTLGGVGRFFIHFTQSVLSTQDQINTSHLNAYKLNINSFITIEGLANQGGQTSVTVYDILGKQVVSATLDNHTNTQKISTETVAAGIYIIKLDAGNIIVTKKLIIK